MRVLMLSQFYPPTVGGEERHVHDLSHALAARGHSIAVATLRHAGLPSFENESNVRVYRMRGTAQRFAGLFSETNRRHVPPLPDPEIAAQLRRIIVREKPDIVHAHNWLVYSFLPLKKFSGAKLVLTLHDYSLVCAKKSFLYADQTCAGPGIAKCFKCAAAHYGAIKGAPTVAGNFAMSAWTRASVDQFIAVSQAVAKHNRLGTGNAPVNIVPNFVPDDFRVDELAQSPQLPGEPYLLYVGDLRRFKGIATLLAAYQALQDAPPLVLIGRKDADTPRWFPQNVFVLEPQPHDAVMRAWRKSLFGLLPSIGPETFGIAALEAMAMGRPVIASRIGGLPDVVVDGETGLLVPPGDVPALRSAVQTLLTDASLLRRLGHAAQQRALQFRASKVVPQIERIYQRVLRQ